MSMAMVIESLGHVAKTGEGSSLFPDLDAPRIASCQEILFVFVLQ